MDNKQKIFLYLDKNILQYDYENAIRLKPIDNVCFVYSDEHFIEISRFVDDRIFEVLERIKARKIKIELDSKFNIMDQATVLEYQDPRLLYNNYQETTKDGKQYSDFFIELQPFFMGNTSSIEPGLVKDKFVNQLNDLINDISFDGLPDSFQQYFKITVRSIADSLEQTLINSQSKILPIKVARKKITNKRMSELNPSDGKIIDQIWEHVKDKFPGIEQDQLFGKKPLPYMNIEKMPIFLGIAQCHSILNTLGYYPDKGLTKPSKAYGISSDAAHLAHSIFCSGVISADDHFCRKASAIFEYFEYKTQIIQLRFE
jgi:hypothetical protein